MTSTVRSERRAGGVAVVTLDRPAALNAIDVTMMDELATALADLDRDADTRAIVLTGAGEWAFSAGFDIDEMVAMGVDELTLLNLRREEWLWRIVELGTPVVAALQGIVHGAGALLALAADVRVGTPRTQFRFTAGAYNGANFTWCLPPLVGMGNAKAMLMTAAPVDADTALRTGLLNHVIPDAELLDRALALAGLIAANPPDGVREIKRLVHEHVGRRHRDRLEAENTVMMTTLRPGPAATVFGRFLGRRAARTEAERRDASG